MAKIPTGNQYSKPKPTPKSIKFIESGIPGSRDELLVTFNEGKDKAFTFGIAKSNGETDYLRISAAQASKVIEYLSSHIKTA